MPDELNVSFFWFLLGGLVMVVVLGVTAFLSDLSASKVTPQEPDGRTPLSPEDPKEHTRETTETVVDSYRLCVDCGRFFFMAADEKGWFKAKNLAIPKRCQACREKRRARRATAGR